MLGNFPIVELGMWSISMLAVSVYAFLFSMKLKSMDPIHSSMPKTNAAEGARLFFIFGLNYLIITVASLFLLLTTPEPAITELVGSLKQWWLVEIFIFFNIITTYCLFTARKRVVINERI